MTNDFAESSNGKDSRLADLKAMLDAYEVARCAPAKNAIVAGIGHVIEGDVLFYARAAALQGRDPVDSARVAYLEQALSRVAVALVPRNSSEQVSTDPGRIAERVESLSSRLATQDAKIAKLEQLLSQANARAESLASRADA